MAANNIDQHTNHNYRLRGTEGLVLRSSRQFNQNNCMGSRSLRRNIISNHFVQPYTHKFDDGTCDYDIARSSELQSNNLQYHFRPQNMEEQLGLGTDHIHSVTGSKLDQMYNLSNAPGNLNNEQLSVNNNLDFSRSANAVPGGYPHAFSSEGDVMGNFNYNVNHGPNYETFDYMPPAPPQQLLSNNGRNFGQVPPNAENQFQTPSHYSNNPPILSYRQLNLNRPFNRPNYPRNPGVSLQEDFQAQPRNGWYNPNFFFDSKENYISVLSGDYGYSNYEQNPKFSKDGLTQLSTEEVNKAREALQTEVSYYEKNITYLQDKVSSYKNLSKKSRLGQLSPAEQDQLNALPVKSLQRYLQAVAQLNVLRRRVDELDLAQQGELVITGTDDEGNPIYGYKYDDVYGTESALTQPGQELRTAPPQVTTPVPTTTA